MQEESLLTTAEAAKQLKVSTRALQKWAHDGRVRPTMTLPSGHYRWRMSDLYRQLERRERDQGR